jgi:hypothetical protein
MLLLLLVNVMHITWARPEEKCCENKCADDRKPDDAGMKENLKTPRRRQKKVQRTNEEDVDSKHVPSET